MRDTRAVNRLSAFSVVINIVQIAAVLVIAGMVLIGNHLENISVLSMEFVIGVSALLIIWGAVVDILQAFSTRRIQEQSDMLQEAYGQLESLNTTLRAQRHDFMNHLQVVYSLIEMEEQREAADYIEKVYGDIKAVSHAMRTQSPAVNALLKVKLAECERRGIHVELDITSIWQDLPIQGWEMCRVLSNLIDNAMDALADTEAPLLTVMISEDLRAYRFRVSNNGPKVPENLRERVFQSGYTTKRTGQGMGLHIVQTIMRKNGGDIFLQSDKGCTAFEGMVPRAYASPIDGENPSNK